MPRDQSKLCIACAHSKEGSALGCRGVLDLTTGRPVPMSAAFVRQSKTYCGPEGRLFEAKAAPAKKTALVAAE